MYLSVEAARRGSPPRGVAYSTLLKGASTRSAGRSCARASTTPSRHCNWRGVSLSTSGQCCASAFDNLHLRDGEGRGGEWSHRYISAVRALAYRLHHVCIHATPCLARHGVA
ncbi:hypothetical protein JIQ42_05265 [Leishmania sp. Namibia]|uniref:hypothetical protein n=1 Tax=Leishmania sp. Namibia TaxID=2802991 RepID=UPI001B4A7B3E|nr:hypothetical protein JIQ42_05265 [Leishmania sp. Namibia]